MKYKGIFIYLLGGSLILSGLSIFGYNLYLNKDIQRRIDENIEKSIIYVDDASFDVTLEEYKGFESTLLKPEDIVIDVLDSDQVIKEVKTYSNVIEIEHLGIKAYVNEGVDSASLSGGLGRHVETASIGDAGNCVIAGHSSVNFNCIFNDLNKIELLESFNAYDSKGKKHVYYVTKKYICDPYNTGILHNPASGISTLTLYTCANGGTKRLIVEGKEFNELELNEFRKELKESYMNNMLSMNKSFDVSNIYQSLDARTKPKVRKYTINFNEFHHENKSIGKGLLGIKLGDEAFDNKHNFTKDFNLNIGINIKGGNLDDVSED